MDWFIRYRPNLVRNVASFTDKGKNDGYLLSLVSKDKLVPILEKMTNEEQFLSDYGLRSLSKKHKNEPFHFDLNGQRNSVGYEPGIYIYIYSIFSYFLVLQPGKNNFRKNCFLSKLL